MNFVGMSAEAQERIVIDWPTRTLVSSPPEVGVPTGAIVSVQNVNDVLYDYQVDIAAVARPVDDLANLLDGIVPAGAPETAAPLADVCPTVQARATIIAADQAIEKNDQLTPNPDKDGKFKSVALQATLTAWEKEVTPLFEKVRELAASIQANSANCADPVAAKTFLGTEYPLFLRRIAEFEGRLARPHVVNTTITLRPDTDYAVTVLERFAGKETIDGSKTFKFSPASTVLTLSAGVLFTTVEGRIYVARSTPTGVADPATRTVVAVDGGGAGRPLVAALLNYQIPRLDSSVVGATVSSGPVLRFTSGSSNTSSLGYFVGVSAHLWRRLFITPGVHIAEFGDFPVGFSGGSVVPADFGELIPTKRWTGRFAVSISYRTATLAKVVKAPTTSSPPK